MRKHYIEICKQSLQTQVKLISLHRASSNFSTSTRCSSLQSRAAQQRLLQKQHTLLQSLHNNSRDRKLLFEMAGKMVFAAFKQQPKRTYLSVLWFACGLKNFSTSPPQLKPSFELSSVAAKLRLV